MPKTPAYAAFSAREPLRAHTIDRRDPGPHDVVIDILFCGVCHSDVHQVRDEWGGSKFPMVPGHEIVGRVTRVGEKVTKLRPGDLAGVGCIVDSCRECPPCKAGLEQFCQRGGAFTYNGTEMDRKTPTYGGYSTQVVVTESFVLRVPEKLDPAAAAPLLCAGITTYSPLRQHGAKAGDRIAVVGLGGLGHMAVKLARSLGAEVTVFSTSAGKEEDARRLGAKDFAVSRDPKTFKTLAGSFDLVLNTLSAKHDLAPYVGLLRPKGSLVLLGVPPEPHVIPAFALIAGNRNLAGSMIGGIAETQEMLEHCAAHDIVSDIEIIPVQQINEAYERMMRSDVRYRFVIDTASFTARS